MNKKTNAILIGIILLAAAISGVVLFQFANSPAGGGLLIGNHSDRSTKNDDEDTTTEFIGSGTVIEMIGADTTTSSTQETTTESNKKDETAKSISFPYTIPGTTLVVTKIDSYDGIFLEDGSDKEVTGISTIVLENKGSKGVEYADISINQNGKELKFKATDLPAGKTVVVQEANGTAFNKKAIDECTAQVAEIDEFEMSESFVKVKELEDGSLEVKNLTNKKIPAVRVFYKFALEKGEIYVGGITYTAKVTDLEPGATKVINPSHYAAGSSEIMMVRVYDTAE